MAQSFGVYIHIPYCFHKCPYCDFNTYAVTSVPEESYLGALLAELDYMAVQPEWHARPIHSIFFGGGTPSLLRDATIRKIIDSIKNRFDKQINLEVSLEANPGSLTLESLEGYKAAGVTRLSIGAQSLLDTTLRSLGRVHTPLQVESSVVTARSVGFKNISLDLMFAAPEQTINDLEYDIDLFCELNPDHISTYGLTIEKGTPFYASYKRGTLKLPTEEKTVEMMLLVESRLSQRNYSRYEISNFAKLSYEARHNLAYWNGADYLGLGAGAHSFNKLLGCQIKSFGKRWSNIASPQQYIEKASSHGSATAWSEELTIEARVFEYFFLGLRKIEGVSMTKFQDLFCCDINQVYPGLITILSEKELVEIQGDRLRLSKNGVLLADSVIESFIECDSKLLRQALVENDKKLRLAGVSAG